MKHCTTLHVVNRRQSSAYFFVINTPDDNRLLTQKGLFTILGHVQLAKSRNDLSQVFTFPVDNGVRAFSERETLTSVAATGSRKISCFTWMQERGSELSYYNKLQRPIQRRFLVLKKLNMYVVLVSDSISSLV